jgi:hypothetical protein
LTGVIVLIFPGKSFQVVVVALCNVCFFAFLALEKPHLPGPGRNLANLSSFAITFTMLLGLIMKSIDDAKLYSDSIAVLLIGVNGTVLLYTLYLIVYATCDSILVKCQNLCLRSDKKQKVMIRTNLENDNITQARIKRVLEAEKLDSSLHRYMSSMLNMSHEARKEYSSTGKIQQYMVAAFVEFEKQMRKIESAEKNKFKEGQMIRLLGGDPTKSKVNLTKIVPDSVTQVSDTDQTRDRSNDTKQYWDRLESQNTDTLNGENNHTDTSSQDDDDSKLKYNMKKIEVVNGGFTL